MLLSYTLLDLLIYYFGVSPGRCNGAGFGWPVLLIGGSSPKFMICSSSPQVSLFASGAPPFVPLARSNTKAAAAVCAPGAVAPFAFAFRRRAAVGSSLLCAFVFRRPLRRSCLFCVRRGAALELACCACRPGLPALLQQSNPGGVNHFRRRRQPPAAEKA